MNYKIYLTIGVLAMIVLSAGCLNISSVTKAEPPQAREIVKTPVPTPVQTPQAPQAKIIIEYFITKTDKLTKYIDTGYNTPVYEYPSPGMTYVILNLKITNHGYQMITINKFLWDMKASTPDNPKTFIEVKRVFQGEPDGVVCPNAELENGGWTNCKAAFEVPANLAETKAYYRGGNNANVEWIQK